MLSNVFGTVRKCLFITYVIPYIVCKLKISALDNAIVCIGSATLQSWNQTELEDFVQNVNKKYLGLNSN
jgi:hypothetical protein